MAKKAAPKKAPAKKAPARKKSPAAIFGMAGGLAYTRDGHSAPTRSGRADGGPRKTCEFMVVTDEGKLEKAGSITFTPPGGITVQAARGYENAMDNIASGRAQTGRGRENQAKKDPAGWFKSLPNVFRGTYLWCRMVDDPGQAAHGKLKNAIKSPKK